MEQGRWPVVIQSQTVETVTDTIDRGPLGGQLLREDGDEVLLLQVGPVVEPGEEVVHLLVVGELGPLVAHPPLQHPRLDTLSVMLLLILDTLLAPDSRLCGGGM